MNIRELFYFAMEYLKIGIIVGIIFLLGVLVYRSKRKKEEKGISNEKIFFAFLFLAYFVVLLCATLARGGQESIVKLQPFSSYISAWNCASEVEWRNLLVNILLFVPFGFFFPFLFGKCKVAWKTYVAGGIISIFIECLQFIFHRGIVEFDDMFNNIIGTMIGYGIYMIFAGLVERIRNKNVKLLPIFLFQIPFVVVVVSYSIFFSMYARLEFGTLSCKYNEIVDMSKSNVTTQCEFSTEGGSDYAYKGKVLTSEECKTVAQDYFSLLGYDVDDEQTVFYDNVAMFKSRPGRYMLSVFYRGGGYELTDFGEDEESAFFQSDVSGLSEEEIRNLLYEYHVTLPSGEEMQEIEGKSYRFEAHMVQEGDTWWNGICTVTPISETGLSSFNNQMLAFTMQSKVKIISEKEAYDQLMQGKFVLPEGVKSMPNMVITGVELAYEIDSIGYAQPIYEFQGEMGETEIQIRIPALDVKNQKKH